MTDVSTSFAVKSYLPTKTQQEIDRIEAISSGLRTAAEAALLVALAPYLTNKIISIDPVTNLITEAAGNTVPTGSTGFKKGARFTDLDTTTNSSFINIGDETSAVWAIQFSTSGNMRIFTGTAADVAAVYAEVGTIDSTGSIYLSSAGSLFVQVANAAASTDWKAVTLTA